MLLVLGGVGIPEPRTTATLPKKMRMAFDIQNALLECQPEYLIILIRIQSNEENS